MLDKVLEILGNSHFEAYVGGPIAGIIAALLFSWVNSSSNGGGSAQNPRDIFIQINHQHNESARRRNASGNGNDDASTAIGIGLLGLVASFLFVAYLPQISLILYFCVTSVCAFTLSSCLIILGTGRFNGAEWLRYTLIPSFLSIGGLVVAFQAERAISPDVIKFAHELLGDGKITLPLVLNGAIAFYRNIGNDYAKWITLQMAAFLLVTLSSLTAFLGWLHFTALANARTSNGTFWVKVAISTHRYSSVGSTFIAAIFLFIAWLCTSGAAYGFING
jgi:hypothetical protein